ncbi:MAG: ARMT1-like domain-containing protein [Cyanobacteria bacterium P01_F01_bin.143]
MNLRPNSIQRTRGKGFADYTIIHRFPQIAAQVKEVVSSKVLREKIDTLIFAIENGEALQVDSGRLDIQAANDWGEPRHFSQLDADLVTNLEKADVVIAKGDLNYRRFIEDRMWPEETSVIQASHNVPFSAFALRILKSEAIAGIPAIIHQNLNICDPDWRCNGKYAIIQRIGGAFS